ncbi:MAG: entericidin A/B family lipoprotein [Thiobacillus sp.]
MKPMMTFLIVAALTLAGCNTVQGIGQDIGKAGDAIERAGSK